MCLDIGGSLIKLVYFSPDASPGGVEQAGGRLHFLKASGLLLPRSPAHALTRATTPQFETSAVDECIRFIEAKGLHRCAGRSSGRSVLRATGGGAVRFADLFQQRLGLTLEKEDEMGSVVCGANFLLQELRDEAFTFASGVRAYLPHLGEADELFPYLLVNIGSGVSILRVEGDSHERVSGTNLGGGTFWGLNRLLTGCKSFDAMLALSATGNNAGVDMLVGDIYGGGDYALFGLSATTIASSFGRVVMDIDKELSAYNPADISLSLLRAISYNIGQIAVLNALRLGLTRIFFGGFFIRGHPYTMDTISFAIDFWSKGTMKALFLRHEGFLGALGAFLRHYDAEPEALPVMRKGSWIERFTTNGRFNGSAGSSTGAPSRRPSEDAASPQPQPQAQQQLAAAMAAAAAALHVAAGGPATASASASAAAPPLAPSPSPPAPASAPPPAASPPPIAPRGGSKPGGVGRPPSSALQEVGVLHLVPSLTPFPLLRPGYTPDTLDLVAEPGERAYWLGLMRDLLPGVAAKAAASEPSSPTAAARAASFAAAFSQVLDRACVAPACYGQVSLGGLFEQREECLRAHGFADAYAAEKAAENDAALAVLPDLLAEVDALPRGAGRTRALIEGMLSGNVFDWGSAACVALYENNTILGMYRAARGGLLSRPWAVDHSSSFAARLERGPTYARALLFVDNSGADVVLGVLPFARELLERGTDVVLVANSLPALNDVTHAELGAVLDAAGKADDVIARALRAAQDAGPPGSGGGATSAAEQRRTTAASASSSAAASALPPGRHGASLGGGGGGGGVRSGGGGGIGVGGASSPPPPGAPARLWRVSSGAGSPCVDLRRVSTELASAAVCADLVLLEGMGRAVHTNLNARLRCDTLKVALLKNERLAHRLFGGGLFSCVCQFEPAEPA